MISSSEREPPVKAAEPLKKCGLGFSNSENSETLQHVPKLRANTLPPPHTSSPPSPKCNYSTPIANSSQRESLQKVCTLLANTLSTPHTRSPPSREPTEAHPKLRAVHASTLAHSHTICHFPRAQVQKRTSRTSRATCSGRTCRNPAPTRTRTMPQDPPKTPERRVDVYKFVEQDKTWLQKAKVYPSEEVAKPSLSATLILDDKVWPSLPKIENDDQTSLIRETSLEERQPSSEYRVATKALRASGDVIDYESPYPTTDAETNDASSTSSVSWENAMGKKGRRNNRALRFDGTPFG